MHLPGRLPLSHDFLLTILTSPNALLHSQQAAVLHFSIATSEDRQSPMLLLSMNAFVASIACVCFAMGASQRMRCQLARLTSYIIGTAGHSRVVLS